MTKKIAGAKRGAKPLDDEKNLNILADELMTTKHTTFAIETDTKIGGKPSYNITSAYKTIAKKQNNVGDHDDADRKRLSRKLGKELREADKVVVEDGEELDAVPRLEAALVRNARKHGQYLPDKIAKNITD